MQEQDAPSAQLVKFFGLVLNQYRLYSERHPAAQLAIRNFLHSLQEIFASAPAVTLGSAGGRLIVNDHPLDAKTNGVVALVKECERFGIESLTFEQGTDADEITSFFKLMALPPKTLQEKGGFGQAFAMANFQHVQLGTVRYLAVGEGETLVENGDEKSPAKQLRKIERMDDVIECCLTGASDAVTFDTERLSYELERNPRAVAQAMVRRALQSDMLKIIVKAVESFLKNRLAPFYLQQGKDLSQPIYSLAKEFKRTLKEVGVKRTSDLVFPLERCADTVKVELMVKAYREGDQNTLERASRMCRKGAREQLRERLMELGVEGGVFEQLFPEKVKRKSRKAYVPIEELEELHRIRDRFEEELAARVAQRTDTFEQERTKAVREKERMAGILRKLGQALVVLDAEGKIECMNPAAEKLLGVTEAAGKGVAIQELLKADHLLVLAKNSLGGKADDKVEEIEATCKDEEARRRLQESTVIIEAEDGEVVGMVSAWNNGTGQKRLDPSKSEIVLDTDERRRAVAGDG
ncbi:MAG: hypothetical protein ACREP8_11775 [Candidatus Binatia bacterium]